MNGKILFAAADIINFLKNTGIIDSNGDWHPPTDAAKDTQLAAGVERILANYGVAIPDKVDKIIQMIPLILELVK